MIASGFSAAAPLAEVVEHQRWQHHGEPGQANRELAEVPHIGIQRLDAGDRQHHRPSAKNDTFLYSMKKLSAHLGFSACSTSGFEMMLRAPSTANTMNHSSITGANSLPTLPVPCF